MPLACHVNATRCTRTQYTYHRVLCPDSFSQWIDTNRFARPREHFFSSYFGVARVTLQAIPIPKSHQVLIQWPPAAQYYRPVSQAIQYGVKLPQGKVVTGHGMLIFIKLEGIRIWWFEHTFAPEVRTWVILSDVTLLAIELWYILVISMQKTLCHLFTTRGKSIGMSYMLP